jgi:hypothetical protein
MHGNVGEDKNQEIGPHERMCLALDSAPTEYLLPFGITKESWQRWRRGGRGTRSGGTKQWTFPRLPELRYPTTIRAVGDRQNLVRNINLDCRLSDRCRRVLTVLAISFLNLKTGRCDPTVAYLAMMAGLGEDPSAERMARLALAEGEAAGWISRAYRFNGPGRKRSTDFLFLIPDAVMRPDKSSDAPGQIRPTARTSAPKSPSDVNDSASRLTGNSTNREYEEHLSFREPSSLRSDGPTLSEERKREFGGCLRHPPGLQSLRTRMWSGCGI